MFIQVEAYSDFDIPVTVCVLYSETEYDIKSLLSEFSAKQRLKGHKPTPMGGVLKIAKDGISGLTSKELSGANHNLTDNWITFLKKRGFKPMKTKRVSFSD